MEGKSVQKQHAWTMVNSSEATTSLTHILESKISRDGDLDRLESIQRFDHWNSSETLKKNEVEDDCNHLAVINSCMPGKTWEREQTPLGLQQRLLQTLHRRKYTPHTRSVWWLGFVVGVWLDPMRLARTWWYPYAIGMCQTFQASLHYTGTSDTQNILCSPSNTICLTLPAVNSV